MFRLTIKVERAGLRLSWLTNILVLCAAASTAQATGLIGRFGVVDSVQAVKFVDPTPDRRRIERAFNVSPDGRQLAIVTQMGVLSDDSIECALTVFNLAQATEALERGDTDLTGYSRRIAIIRSTTNRLGIDMVRWMPDGGALTFLGSCGDEPAQVFKHVLGTEGSIQLTWETEPIRDYDLVGDRLIYVIPARVLSASGPIADGYLPDSLSPVAALQLPRPISGIQSNDSSWSVVLQDLHTNARKSIHSLSGRKDFFHAIVRLSPDGRKAAGIIPAATVQAEWKEYFLGSARGNLIAPGPNESPYIAQYVIANLDTDVAEPLISTPVGGSTGYRLSMDRPVWGADSKTLFLLSARLPLIGVDYDEKERRKAAPSVVEVDLDSRRITEIFQLPAMLNPEGQAAWPEMANNGAKLTVRCANRAGLLPDRVFLREQEGWREIATPATPWLEFSQAVDLSPDLYLVDAVGRRGRLTKLNPSFCIPWFGKTEIIQWTDARGTAWQGGLIYPPNYTPERRYPLAIQTYGFHPEEFLLDGPHGTAFSARALAASGLMVLQMSQTTRGFGTIEEGPSNMAGFESAIDSLAGRGLIDSDRVGLVGFSRTGFHVRYAITHSKYPIAAAVVADAVDYGYLQYILYRAPANVLTDFTDRRHQQMNAGLPFGAGLRNWAMSAPAFNVENVTAALLTQAMGRSSILSDWELHGALKILGRPAEFLFIDHAPHELVRPRQRARSMSATVDWLAFWLSGRERKTPITELGETEPELRARYDRWRNWRESRRPAG